jgi:hypothetical protein
MSRYLLALGAALVLVPAVAMAEPAAPAAAAPAAVADPFAMMDGEWRGAARIMTASGPLELVQTERSGTMLGGKVRLVEGRGYLPGGKLAFNAVAVIAARTGGGYEMRSWTLEQAGAFAIEPTATGFTWTIPAGPATIRYEATIRKGTWTEVGTRHVPGQPPVEFFRMELVRIGDSDWPAGGVVGPD